MKSVESRKLMSFLPTLSYINLLRRSGVNCYTLLYIDLLTLPEKPLGVFMTVCMYITPGYHVVIKFGIKLFDRTLYFFRLLTLPLHEEQQYIFSNTVLLIEREVLWIFNVSITSEKYL